MIALAFASTVVVGCGDEGALVSTPAGAEDAAEPDLDALAAIGYADWDLVADGVRAGVTVHAIGRVQPGVTLYANDVDRAFAIALDGEFVHEWRIPGRTQVEHVLPLGDGRVAAVSVDEGVTVVDRDSRVVWSADLRAHHDVAALEGGALLVPEWVEHGYRGRRVRFDRLVRVADGDEPRVVWDGFARREELQALHPPLALDEPRGPDEPDGGVYDYYHLNTVEVLGETPLAEDPRFRAGNLLLCFRNANLVVVLDGETFDVVWSYRPGILDMPHTPTLTDAGTLLIFDNGRHRGWSRLLEIEPRTEARVWSFRAEPRESFYSEIRGACRRLANGNTLVTESERGRVFEIDAEGDVVWEFWNPVIVDGGRRRIYRATRYAEADVFSPR